MIKNALTLKRSIKVDGKLWFQIGSGILYGVCMDQRLLPILIVHLHSVYKEGLKRYFAFVTFLCLFSFYIGNYIPLVYLLICVLYAGIEHVYSIFHKNIESHLFLWHTLLTILGTYLLYGNSTMIFVYAGMSFMLSFLCTHLNQQEKETKFSLLSVVYLILISYFKEYAFFIETTYLIVCVYTLPLQFSVLICFYFALLGYSSIYLLYLIMIGNYTKYRFFISLFSWFFLLTSFSFETLYFASLCTLLGMFAYESDDAFMIQSNRIEKEHELYMIHSFYRQLMNYANVFYNLGHYYDAYSEELSQIMKRMAEAMEYNGKISKQYMYTNKTIQERIEELLRGYHFSLLACEVKQTGEKIRLSLEVEHLYKQEIEDVILPMLEKQCSCKLRVHKCLSYPFRKDTYKLMLESEEYPIITTYGNGVHVHEMSGDSFHCFEMDSYVFLMLSDGMGRGIQAKKTSSILIQIMESMLRCHIPQVECITLLNMFLHSDIYATLDVLCFDRKNKKAYLSKAASAPTYLLRENVLYEMNAHSLPIGIVDQVNADVYEITYQSKDIFIMCSDGVSKNEIEKWQSLRRCNAIKNEGLNLLNIIKEKKRMDDSTILMAKID